MHLSVKALKVVFIIATSMFRMSTFVRNTQNIRMKEASELGLNPAHS